MDAGLFDETNRVMDGCADWDLWLRLARAKAIAGTDECLARYRLHGESLSADTAGMQRAAEAVARKHFGPDDGRPEAWPIEKRQAYGGVYRHGALLALLRRGDWEDCARYLRLALRADPALAADLDLFYDLALGTQPLGLRGTSRQLDLDQNAERVEGLLEGAFAPGPVGQADSLPRPSDARAARRLAESTASYALGLAAYNTGRFGLSRRYLLRALRLRPALWRDRRLAGALAKSFLGPALVAALKQRSARAAALEPGGQPPRP
jgi:hypothetical protein